jgi:hypothetical protein
VHETRSRQQLNSRKDIVFIPLAAVLLCLFVSCATFRPGSINDVRFRDRMQSKYDQEIRVSVAVPTAEESQALFGVDMAEKEIQPVWLKVENHADRPYYMLVAGVDPNYFSAMEASFSLHGGLSSTSKGEMENYFKSMTFRNPIPPNTAVSGFVFTNHDEGEKVVQVDLIANERAKFFTFFIQIPGMRVDYRMVDFDALYSDKDIVEVDDNGLRAALEKLPCCTTDETGTRLGDPLNLVVIGSFHDVAAAFARRGWLPAEETYSTAIWKTIMSYLFGWRYRYSPISSLYFYRRHQDFARQKPRRDIHERNHLRLWYSPIRLEGKPVFVGQISRDIGVRFTTKTWPPVTHKIDPDIDEARHSVVEDLVLSQSLARVGFVKGVGRVTVSKPRRNLTGDPYYTDGLRTVMVLEKRPISLQQIRTFDWEEPDTFRLEYVQEN